MKVLKMKVVDAASAARGLDVGTSAKELELCVIPEKMSMMQITPDGKMMIFYVEEQEGAQG